MKVGLNIALIMAKEGSLGLPGKNIWKINERTLLEWAILDAKNSKKVNQVWVSTNGKETADLAEKAGAHVVMRDDELAKNEKFMDAVDHAIRYIKQKYPSLNIIAIPQCVVPFRDPDIFDRCISFLKENQDYDSVVTIRPTAYIPEAIMKISQEGQLVPYFSQTQTKVSGSRQDSAGYEIDHVVECFRYESWLNRREGIKPWDYLGRRIKGITQNFHNPNCYVDVHTIDDVRWLKFIVDHLGYGGMTKESVQHEWPFEQNQKLAVSQQAKSK